MTLIFIYLCSFGLGIDVSIDATLKTPNHPSGTQLGWIHHKPIWEEVLTSLCTLARLVGACLKVRDIWSKPYLNILSSYQFCHPKIEVNLKLWLKNFSNIKTLRNTGEMEFGHYVVLGHLAWVTSCNIGEFLKTMDWMSLLGNFTANSIKLLITLNN